ncbi:thioredoxin domain-containing protein [Candidatus Nitrosacidococcus tergens]|uniref:Spermatogenesis-associated protein 20-like TRX domain-containing protein n=1 Tax=Candidatus Nitrosacidococcus tergens TaxID=553981 RepID=A0A7G1Q8D8_9GAMM|nr:thioredoxin domain-containing protein [Candidatus Nitrosacidococcus tergens]CAB1274601.1 conserved protein of unknown function [Candidatus Nitrosacidococcus tergens]
MKNHLQNETSPYLLQHVDNPVNWYPWNKDALDRASQEKKPILLSIGYSACHWCHVMAHESFEDKDTALIMNQHFINIKVDREERPDLDQVYQLAQQMLTGRAGGWPLTLFLEPTKQVPFFSGTYFPPEGRYGLPGFKDLLQQISQYFYTHSSEIYAQNSRLLAAFRNIDKRISIDKVSSLDFSPLKRSQKELTQSFDFQYGGMKGAPKFPNPPIIERYLNEAIEFYLTKEEQQQSITKLQITLDHMALGGIYDQIGGGFYRYSVDGKWQIPHFEKMLYDNGQLLFLYSKAYSLLKAKLYHRVLLETGNWVIREMQSSEGGYYSSLDADSEGHEGKYYIWSQEEIQSILDDDEYQLASRYFGLDQPSNFEGCWHLHCAAVNTETLAQKLELPLDNTQKKIITIKERLRITRNNRIYPTRDGKILTSWNGLMIKGMVSAGQVLNQPSFIDSAERALKFIYNNLWINNRLLATYKDKKARYLAYLDDYAFLIDALITLLQTQWKDEYLAFLIQLTDTVLTHFENKEQGGFYFTAHDQEIPISRLIPLTDNATPSGNGVMTYNLIRLGHLLGNMVYLEAAERCLKTSWFSVQQIPHAHCSLLKALESYLYPPEIIILRGPESVLTPWHSLVLEHYLQQRIVLAIPSHAKYLPKQLEKYQSISSNGVTAYICHGQTCLAPITEFESFKNHFKVKDSSQSYL